MRFIAWRLPGLLGLVFFGATLLPYTVPLVRAHEQHMAPDHSQTMPGAPAKYSRQFADYTIPPVALVDMSGADVTLSDALQSNPPVLLDFIFTTCTTICPITSAIYAEAQELLANRGLESSLISISIDPEHDSPARLAAYAERFRARPNWRLFTGTRSDIAVVQKAFDAYRGDKANHLPVLFMRPSSGAPWVRIEGFAGAAEIVDEYLRMVSHGAPASD